MPNVLISGGSGMIGKHLTDIFLDKGYHVNILTRKPSLSSKKVDFIEWDPAKGQMPDEAIASADHVINLAGANLFKKRWTESYKDLIMKSRVQSTRLLADKLANVPNQVKTFISASGINYYGLNSKEIQTEENSSGNDFLAKVCEAWEKEANRTLALDPRTVILRFGIVLSKEGGALKLMELPTKFGLGAAVGSGDQYIPWVHLDDLTGILMHAIEHDQVNGAYNVVAPEDDTLDGLMKKLAEFNNRPYFFPNVPGFLVKAGIGEFADVILSSLRASPQKIIDSGYNFKFPNLEEAFKSLYK